MSKNRPKVRMTNVYKVIDLTSVTDGRTDRTAVVYTALAQRRALKN